MADVEPGLFGGLLERPAAKIKPVKAKRHDRVRLHASDGFRPAVNLRDAVDPFHHARRRDGIEPVSLPRQLEAAAREICPGRVPPAQPGIFAHFVCQPAIGDVVNSRQAAMAQGKNQGLGQAAQAPDINQVGFALGDCLAQDAVIALFEFLQCPQP